MLNPLAPFRVALRDRNLRLLLTGLAASQAGDWLYNLALLAFVYERTHSSMWVGVTTAVRIVPEVVLGPLGGALADRIDRRALMLGSDAARALTMAALAFAAAAHAPVALAPVLAAFSTAAGAAYPQCVVAILPRLTTDEQLPAANAARVSVTFLCIVAGPAIGALLLVIGTPAVAFALNGATFAIGLVVVRALPREALRRPAAIGSRRRIGRELQAGWAALRQSTDGTGVLGADIVASAVYGALTVLLVLGFGSSGYGYLLAAAGLGGVLATGFAQRAASSRRARRVLAPALVAVGAPLPLLALGGSLPAAAALAAVFGAGSIVTEVVGDTCLQRSLDPVVFARAYGLVVPASVAAIALGALLAPLCVTAFGLTATFAGLGCIVVGYAAVVHGARRIRRLATAAAVAGGVALAGASVAAADVPAPSTPVHADAAGVAHALFVAGDVERLTQVPSGTESIVLEKVLQQLYADNPLLGVGQAVADVQGLQATLSSGSGAISPATLTLMGGNARILAILRALSDSRPPAEVQHALAQVTAAALSGASSSFDATADSLSTLSYSSFSPAGTLAATAARAASNHVFGQARDALWQQASHESVFDSTQTLVSENPALDTDAIKGFMALVGADGTMNTTVGAIEDLLHAGIAQIGDQTQSAIDDAKTVAQQCPNGSGDTSAACQSARSAMRGDAGGQIATISDQRTATAAEATALGAVDPALQEAEAAEAEAAAQVSDDAEAYLQDAYADQVVHTTLEVTSIAINLAASEVDPAAAVGAVLAVIGNTTGYAFADPNTQILKGIQDVSRQLASFEQYTSLAFEALDTGLTELSNQILSETRNLSQQITNVHDQISALSGTLSALQGSVDRLESEVQSLFAQDAQNDLVRNVNTYLGYAQKNGGRQLTAEEFNTAAATFFTEATTVANSVTVLTKPQDSDFTAAGASRLGTGTDADVLNANINLFNYFPGAVQDGFAGLGWPDSAQDLVSGCGAGASISDRLCLPKPAYWASAARAYAQLLLENPQYVTHSRLEDLNTILSSGQAVDRALHRLSAHDNGSGPGDQSTGNSILDRAISYYRYWGQQLARVLKNEEQNYLATHHPSVYGANDSFSYVGVDPWGSATQSPDLKALEQTQAFTNVPVCPGWFQANHLGSLADPSKFALPKLPDSLISFLPVQVLNAERLGLGHISACWTAAFAGWEPNAGQAGQLTAEVDYTYTSTDGSVSNLVGYAQAQIFAANCLRMGIPPYDSSTLPYIDSFLGISLVMQNWPGVPNRNSGCTDMSSLLGNSANEHQRYTADVSGVVEPAIDNALLKLRNDVYDDVLGSESKLTTGGPDGTNVQAAAQRLAGANALLNGYVSLGLPQALAGDDTLRSLIDGKDANAFMATNVGGTPLQVTPASTIADQVASVYTAAKQQQPDYDPASYVGHMLDNRANNLLYAIRPHIAPGAARPDVAIGAAVRTSSAIAANPITAEENALITPTIDRVALTGVALVDAMSHPAPTPPSQGQTPGGPSQGQAPTVPSKPAPVARPVVKPKPAPRCALAVKGGKRGTLMLTVKCNQAARLTLTVSAKGHRARMVRIVVKARRAARVTIKVGKATLTLKSGRTIVLRRSV